MNNTLDARLAANRAAGRPTLALFLTAGFPTCDGTIERLRTLEEGGADIIELGMPFSDPLADGPVIQRASATALANGCTLPWILEQVSQFRRHSTLPIVLMGYINPILRYGSTRFFRDAASAGVQGIILPEIPLEELPRFAGDIAGNGLHGILLVTPTTPADRVHRIDGLSSGFVYCVSTTGVTGGEVEVEAALRVRELRAEVQRNPMLVGFGISSPERARTFASVADGIIVGSALIRALEKERTSRGLASWVRTYRRAIDTPAT